MVVGKQPNHKDHNLALTTLLNTARKCNVCLNYEKLQYKQKEVEFFRETYTLDGQKPAQGKIKAIQEMPPSQCRKQAQSFMGMINYLSKFSARLSELTELSKEKVPFNWGPEHESTFHLIKKEIVAALILAYYNPNKAKILQTDVSCKGLGACLLQKKACIFCQ